jgi:cysteine desulfurase family protein
VDATIYFDNAATSWPKPPGVLQAMQTYLENIGGSPGRSGHRMAIAAGRLLAEARINLADLFHVDDPSRIVFTKNVTEALNVAILALARPGDHVITTGVEHNAVMRPLRHLEANGLNLTVVPCSEDGMPDLDALESILRRPTRLVVTTHASNVIGNVLPLDSIVALAHRAGVPVLVDAAQTAGVHSIDVSRMGIDLLAFTGHKSLYGPTGTGGLCLGEEIDLVPLLRGGTGSSSELEVQPDFLPDKLESGTLNICGIAGLNAGVQFLLEHGVETIRQHEQNLASRFLQGLGGIRGVTMYGPRTLENKVGVTSFNVDGVSASDVGLILDHRFNIMCRIGLHCAPAAHRTIGTYPEGTVRFGWSYFNTADEVDVALEALRTIVERQATLGSDVVAAR